MEKKNTTREKDILELEAKMNEQKALCETAIKNNNLDNYSKNLLVLDGLLKERNELYAKQVYDDLLSKDNPIIEAITQYSYKIKRVKETRDKETRKITGLAFEDKDRQIDLLKFCKYADFDTFWQYDIEKFNQLLTLRAGKALGLTNTQLKQMSKSYYMEKTAREIEMGETPTSNTQVCKILQSIINKILEDNEGKLKYKCNNYDIGYLDQCYTKKGKTVLGVAMAKHDFLRRLIMDIMHRIICNKKYSAEYKQVKNA